MYLQDTVCWFYTRRMIPIPRPLKIPFYIVMSITFVIMTYLDYDNNQNIENIIWFLVGFLFFSLVLWANDIQYYINKRKLMKLWQKAEN